MAVIATAQLKVAVTAPTLTFDLYGHLFENVEADREDMKKLEAAVRAA